MLEEDKLGRLTPVELRDVWTNESSDFTPWSSVPISGVNLGDLEAVRTGRSTIRSNSVEISLGW